MYKIPYFQTVSPAIAAGAQPTPQDLQDLQKGGFTSIINISPANARNFLASESEIVTASGMKYHYLPIDCSNLQPEMYQDFEALLDHALLSPGAKVFIHCGMNVKSSGMLHIYRVRKLAQTKEQALEALKETPGHEPKWAKYWASWGI